MPKLPNEIQTQKTILSWLEKNDISPFNILFTYSELSGGLLSITFYMPLDLKEFLELVDYKTQCDKSGYEIFEDANTIILRGLALINLYSMI